MNPKLPHVYFIPAMAPGHMIPMVDLARQFAKHGAKSTIITTPLNAPNFSQSIERDQKQGFNIDISLIEFPCQEAGLPAGCENLSSTTNSETSFNFFKALDLLQMPVENFLKGSSCDCIVAGAFFWWATDVAHKLNVPRLIFYGTGFFPMCIYKCLKEHKPYEKGGSNSEEFVIPGLPDEITILRTQIPVELKEGDDNINNPFAEKMKRIAQSESESYGMIVNTFNELEPAYAQHYREVAGIRAWHVGPISLFYNTIEDKTHRGGRVDDHHQARLNNWLNSKRPNSVVYVCFGSMAIFSSLQLEEIARGLESSTHDFIWVVRDSRKLPEGFEEKMAQQGRGLVIEKWAPQVMILEHEAVGGFVTHCGWNSVMEGVAAGVAMATWPLSAEQFFNEKLVVEILGIGVAVGAREWARRTEERAEAVEAEKVGAAVGRLMGEEGEGWRIRVRELGEMGRRAVEKGGSSDVDLRRLIQEIRVYDDSCS